MSPKVLLQIYLSSEDKPELLRLCGLVLLTPHITNIWNNWINLYKQLICFFSQCFSLGPKPWKQLHTLKFVNTSILNSHSDTLLFNNIHIWTCHENMVKLCT